jgi:hypothetical protein
MTKPNSTEIIVILDRSGSMSSIAADMRGGFDEFISQQRALPGECCVTLVQFDDKIETVYTAKPVSDVPPLALVPRGSTALYDAIGRTLVESGERFAAMHEGARPSKVILVIITDGHENASREYQAAKVSRMIKHQVEAYQWETIYLGANQDAVAVAEQIGIQAKQAVTYDATRAGTRAMADVVSASVGATRSGWPRLDLAKAYGGAKARRLTE